MSDPTGTPAVVPPVAPVTPPPVPPAAPAAAPPVVAAPAPALVDQDPAWLPERLKRAKEQAAEQERKDLLKKLGIDDPDKAAQIIAEAKQREEKEKTLAQKHVEAEAKAAKLAERNAQLEAAVVATAKREMAALSESRQAQIKAAAGDDPAAQSRMIAIFAPGWANDDAKAAAAQAAGAQQAPPAAAPVAAPPAPPPIAAPLNTAPPAGAAPPPAPAHAPTNHLAIYEGLEKTNPIGAANYLDMNWAAIDAARKARAG